MKLEMFFNFDGNCLEAVEFYAKVFKTKVHNLMTYKDTPPDPNYILPEADKDRIMYAGIEFPNMVGMFMDVPSGYPLTIGSNISPTISTDDKEEVVRLFSELKEGGTVDTDLCQTFFSELYGMVTDRFGISWQILYYSR